MNAKLIDDPYMRLNKLLETVNLYAQKQAIIAANTLVHTADYFWFNGGKTNFRFKKKETCPRFTGEETSLPLSLTAVDATQASILKLTQCAFSLFETEEESFCGYA